MFSYSYALFCIVQNGNSFSFIFFRTLCAKHPGWGVPPFFRELWTQCLPPLSRGVKINQRLHPGRSIRHPVSPARIRFRINTYPTVRNCCI